MKLVKSTTFKVTVTGTWPVEDKVDVVRQDRFIAKFKQLTVTQLEDMRAEQEAGFLTNQQLLDAVLVGVEGIDDASPDDAVALVKDDFIAATAAATAYWETMNKGPVAKNLKRSPKP